MSDGGFIYAIGAAGASSVKIGKTAGPVIKRLAALQVGYPARLQIRASVHVEQELDRVEKALHQMLETAHLHGEWFAVEVDQVQLEALLVRAEQWLAEAHTRKAMHIGERIQHLRTARRWTQQELADRAGISQPIISRLEKNVRANVNADVLKGLAKALGCTTDYLVGMHEEEESEGVPAALALV